MGSSPFPSTGSNVHLDVSDRLDKYMCISDTEMFALRYRSDRFQRQLLLVQFAPSSLKSISYVAHISQYAFRHLKRVELSYGCECARVSISTWKGGWVDEFQSLL